MYGLELCLLAGEQDARKEQGLKSHLNESASSENLGEKEDVIIQILKDTDPPLMPVPGTFP